MPGDENILLLGEIKGQLTQVIANQQSNDIKTTERFDKIDDRFNGFDARLRTVEQKAAVSGALAGGIASIAVALIVEKFKIMTGMR